MKRQIVDILKDLHGGIAVKGDKMELVYHLQIGNMLQTFRKDVTFNFTEIEDEWKEVRLPLYLNAATMNGINSARIGRKEDSDEAKRWVFVSILQGIIVNNKTPKGQVMIWTEKYGEKIKTCGFCETEE